MAVATPTPSELLLLLPLSYLHIGCEITHVLQLVDFASRCKPKKKKKAKYVGPPISPTRLSRAGPVPAQLRWLGRVQPNLKNKEAKSVSPLVSPT